MARLFDKYMIGNTRILHSVFGYSATYTASTGSVSLNVFLAREFFQQVSGYDATVPKREKTIQAIISDMNGLPYDGYFTIEGTAYQIADVSDDDGHEVTFMVKS